MVLFSLAILLFTVVASSEDGINNRRRLYDATEVLEWAGLIGPIDAARAIAILCPELVRFFRYHISLAPHFFESKTSIMGNTGITV